MSIPAQLPEDPLLTFISEVEGSLERLRRSIGDGRARRGGLADSAVAAGLPRRKTYTVAETARYTGIHAETLYREHRRGRLGFILPRGSERGYRIAVDEMQRWMDENEGRGK